MTLTKIHQFLIIAFIPLILPISTFAQNEVWRYYEVKDTLIVEAERVAHVPAYSTMVSKIPIPLRSTPASVGVVLRPQFESQNATILSDALTNIAGVNIQSNFGVHDYFLIRGLNSLDNGLILTDGTIETESTFYNLYNIERIEVLKGPGSFLYGGNPLSGTVNLWRKKPIYRNFLGATGTFGHFRTFRGTLDFGLADIRSGLAFRMNAFWHESDNFRDEKPSKQFAVNPALTWRLNKKTDITINFEFAQNDFQPDAGLPIQFFFDGTPPALPEVPRERSYQSPFDDSDQKIYRTRADFSTKLSENMTIRNKLYFADQDWQSTGTLLFGAFPTPPHGELRVSRALQNLNDRQKYFGNQFDLLLTFQTGTIRHDLVSGIEFTRYDDDFELKFGGIAPMDLLDPVETTPNILNLLFLQTSAVDARTLIFAPYFVDQVALSAKVKVFLGGRYDIIDYDDKRLDVDVINATSLRTEDERNYKKLSPMGGILVAPSRDVSLYANAGKAFAPPSTLTRGAPEPEESTQIEIGAKLHLLHGKLNTDFALFHLEKNNINIPDSSGVLGQNGDQRSRGIEISISAIPFENVLSTLSYAFTEAELTAFRERFATQNGFFVVDRSGNTAGFAPKHILNFWTTKTFRNGLGFGIGSRYLSKQFVDAGNVFAIEPYLLFNAAIYYQKQGWRWSLNFKNISNRDYEVRGFSGSSVIPADPFTIYSTVKVTL